jgi:protein TonB
VPAAALISLAAVAGFLSLLMGALVAPVAPPPLEVQVVELPPAPAIAPEPPQPELPQSEPPLPPEPQPPPPRAEPDPVPQPQAEPEPPPPPARKPPPPRPAQLARPVQSPSASLPPAAAPAPQPASPAPPRANTAGARAVYQPLPEIPEALRHHALELVAVVRFRVAASGSAEVELVSPTPDPAFNRLLLEALHKWRFFPKIEAGKPVASMIDVRIPISVR